MSVRSHNRAAVMYNDKITGATLTATSESGDLTVDRLQQISLKRKWRSTSAADQDLIADFGETTGVRMVYIGGHNLEEDATIRIRLSENSNLSSPVYDATFPAWVSLFGLDEQPLDEGTLDGVPDTSELQEFQFFTCILLDNILTGTLVTADSTTATLPKTINKVTGGVEYAFDVDDYYIGATIEITDGTGSGQSRSISAYDAATRKVTVETAWSTNPDNTSVFEIDLTAPTSVTINDNSFAARYLGVTISDSLNADSYIEAGVLKAGGYLQPEIDIDYDWQIGLVDPSERFESYDSDISVNIRTKYRTASMTFSYLTEAEADEFYIDMGAKVGSSKPIVAMPFAENGGRLYSNLIYGLLDAPPRKMQMLPDYTNSAYQVTLNIRGL